VTASGDGPDGRRSRRLPVAFVDGVAFLGIPPSARHLSNRLSPAEDSYGRESYRLVSAEFKRDAVALVRTSGRPVRSDRQRSLGSAESSLSYWLMTGPQDGRPPDP